jgi:S1-C subfamily serine protease
MIYQNHDPLLARQRAPLIGLTTVAALLTAVLFSASPVSARESASNQIAQLKRAVVIVTTYDDHGKPLLQGSGFFINPEEVVTNLHVIKGAGQIRIETFAGTTATVQSVTATDETSDLALLRIGRPCPDSAFLQLAGASFEGESVTLVSNPQGSRWQVTRGTTGMLWKFGGIGARLQISATIAPGSSGGPVVNELGQVIGIASLHVDSVDNLNFAVPVKSLKDLQAQARLQSRSGLVQSN